MNNTEIFRWVGIFFRTLLRTCHYNDINVDSLMSKPSHRTI